MDISPTEPIFLCYKGFCNQNKDEGIEHVMEEINKSSTSYGEGITYTFQDKVLLEISCQ